MIVLATVIAGFSLWGWGWLAGRWARVGLLPWPLTLALGMAALVFVGGGLILLRMARPLALDFLLAVGLGAVVAAWRQTGWRLAAAEITHSCAAPRARSSA